jgi:hypothetical protein
MARAPKKTLGHKKVPKTKPVKKTKDAKKPAAAKPKKGIKAAAPIKSRKVAAKKAPVAPVLAKKVSSVKKAAEPVAAPLTKAPSLKAKSSASKAGKVLDLCLLLDCTGSMSSWIQRSKDTLHEIIDTVKAANPGLAIRVCFVGYRDVQDNPRFSIHEFSEDIAQVKKFISGVQATGGGDWPEDVQGGFHKALA